MNTRTITLIALAQLGVVVFGYLFALWGIKLYWRGPWGTQADSWELQLARNYGFLLLALPVLWTFAAIYAQSKRKTHLSRALCVMGISLAGALAVFFSYCFLRGFWFH